MAIELTKRSTAVYSGAKLYIYLNEKILAEAFECSYSITHDLYPIDTIDVLEPAELAEVGYSVSFSASTFRIRKRTAIDLGFQPKLKDILGSKELTFEIREQSTDEVLLQISGAKLVGRSGGVSRKGTFTEKLSFIAKYADDQDTNTNKSISGLTIADNGLRLF
jgi:hypothetical protein